MGWDGVIIRNGYTKADELEELKRHLRPHEVLGASKVKNVWYIALKMHEREEVICAIVLTQRHRSEFIFKLLTEHDGVSCCDCPNKIMKLLTPLSEDATIAREWRTRVSELKRKDVEIPFEEAQLIVFTPAERGGKKEKMRRHNDSWYFVKAKNSWYGTYFGKTEDVLAKIDGYAGSVSFFSRGREYRKF